MRFVVLVKASEESEAGVMPTEEMLTENGAFMDELVKAGVLLAGEGLHPSSRGARVHFDGDERTVVDGPFAEAKELIAGFWILETRSLDEAVEWMKRCPFREGHVEIRRVFESEDFGEEFTTELREQEARQRAEVDKRR